MSPPPMRVQVDVLRQDASSWKVALSLADGRQLQSRVMRRITRPDGSGAGVPIPPDVYAKGLPAAALHRTLCQSTDPGIVLAALGKLVSRTATAGEVEAFGRYLFATLLGEDLWGDITGVLKKGESTELALTWDAAESDLFRFPWELMHGPKSFLCVDGERQISLVHVVKSGAPVVAAGGAPGGQPKASKSICVRPRVLFIVGADLADPSIQAGAEYLGLLRRLQTQGMALDARILLNGNPTRIKDTLAEFRPSIVHIIAHGAIGDDGRGIVYFVSDDHPGKEVPMVAAQLLQLLRVDGQLPQVVVLNACNTAGATNAVPFARLDAPIAVELVQGGVQVVLGHTGKVSDHVCRLFSRRLYEAMLEGESISDATAEGRRAGLMLGADPKRAIDWALPAVYTADGVDARISIDASEEFSKKFERASRFIRTNNPPTFCARLDCIEEFTALLSEKTSAKRVLGFEVTDVDSELTRPQYGKTRLLEELAVRAIFEGVAPCIVTFRAADDLPVRPMEIAQAIARAITETRASFEMPAPGELELIKLLQRSLGDTNVVLAPDVNRELALQFGKAPAEFECTAKVIHAAIALDLVALADEVVAKRPADARKQPGAILLLDEINRYGAATRDLLMNMIGPDGMGIPRHRIPVVLAFSYGAAAPGSLAAGMAIKEFFEKNTPYVRKLRLGAFRSPIEDTLAYRQYLLHLDPPLVVSAEGEAAARFFRALANKVRGVPSRLEVSPNNDAVAAVIETTREIDDTLLSRADDFGALQQLRAIRDQ
jgi:hypothetical protein